LKKGLLEGDFGFSLGLGFNLEKKNSEELSANSFGISSSADLSFSSKYRGE